MGMLVLSRKQGESVNVGPWMKVTVEDIRNNDIRLSFHQTCNLYFIDREEVSNKRPSRYVRVMQRQTGQEGWVVGMPFRIGAVDGVGGTEYAPVVWDGRQEPELERTVRLDKLPEGEKAVRS